VDKNQKIFQFFFKKINPHPDMADLPVSEKHLRYLNDTFRNPASQSYCQDVEIRCCNGTLLYNKLLVGLVFPELINSTEYQLPLGQVLLLPQFSIQDIFQKEGEITKFFCLPIQAIFCC